MLTTGVHRTDGLTWASVYSPACFFENAVFIMRSDYFDCDHAEAETRISYTIMRYGRQDDKILVLSVDRDCLLLFY